MEGEALLLVLDHDHYSSVGLVQRNYYYKRLFPQVVQLSAPAYLGNLRLKKQIEELPAAAAHLLIFLFIFTWLKALCFWLFGKSIFEVGSTSINWRFHIDWILFTQSSLATNILLFDVSNDKHNVANNMYSI